jgi:hypothetical protein
MVMHFHGYKPGRINFKLWKEVWVGNYLPKFLNDRWLPPPQMPAEAAEYALEKEAESKIAAQGCRCNLPYRG